MNIQQIQLLFPDLFKSAKDLYIFDYKVRNMINNEVGEDTLENIIQNHEYNSEIHNVSKNIIKNTKMNRLAQKHKKYFDIYLHYVYNLKNAIGMSASDKILTILKTYFDSASHMHL